MTQSLGGWRLVTLTGAPGIGKTRLALAVARTFAGPEDRAARFVELASLTEPGLVAPAIAAAFSLQEVPDRDWTEALLAHIAGHDALLVLDNCEHQLESCGGLAGMLLHGCPRLRILATSREPLGVVGERVWQVPPLSLPDPGHRSSAPGAVTTFPAVQLFVERAAEVRPDFALDAHTAAAVAEICRRLDGIPLAIELAAARVAMLTPAEIAWRLDDRFTLLHDTRPGALPRHQTLRAALEWSHDLLSGSERALLRQLSVFAGEFDLDAAEAICPGDELRPGEIFDALDRLVTKSLVVADVRNDGARYRLLETVRAYAVGQLAQAGEQGRLEEAHARVYLQLAEAAEPELTGPFQQRWLARLEAERANLRRALTWSLENGRADWALRLAGALVLFWRVRSHFTEGRDLLAAALAAGGGDRPALLAKALWGKGFLSLMAGGPQHAIAPLEQSLALYDELDDASGRARALLVLANAKQPARDPAVVTLLEQSARLAREAGDDWCLAHARAIAGFEQLLRDDLPAARPLFDECIAVARAADDEQSLRIGLLGLGSVAQQQGDMSTAESLFTETVAVGRRLGEDYVVGAALWHRGELAFARGEYARAHRLLDDALALIERGAPRAALVAPLALLARVHHVQGDHDAAHRCFDRALDVERALNASGDGVPTPVLLWRGELALAERDVGVARRLLEQAREQAEVRGDTTTLAQALRALGYLARDTGDLASSATLHDRALSRERETGHSPGLAESLEAVAGLVAAGGRHVHAARLLGSAQALRRENGGIRPPWLASRHGVDVALTREALSADDFEAAFLAGQAGSLGEVLAEARQAGEQPACAWPGLTRSERQVAELAAEGLTNREISSALFISISTVKAHLTRVYRKVGLSRRSELARDAARLRTEAAPHRPAPQGLDDRT